MTSASRDDSQDNLVDSSSEHGGGSGFYINAGMTLASLRSDESSDSDSVAVVTDTRVKLKAASKAARKFQFGRKSKQAPPGRQPSATGLSTHSSEQSGDEGPSEPVAAREDSEELEYLDLDIRPANEAREQASSPSESDVAEGDEAAPEMPSDALIEALEDISLVTIRLATLHRLPFMLRNLRQGFLSRCKFLGIDTSHSLPPPKPITVEYSCAVRIAEDGSPKRQVTRTTMRDWKCPLCELHCTFLSQKILSAHLRWDHSNVDFAWAMVDYTLTLRLPLPGLVPLPPHSRPLLTPTARTASTEISDFSSNKIFSDRNITPATIQPTSRYTSVSSQSFRDPCLLDIKPKYYLPTPPRTGSVVSTNVRSTSVSSRAISRASSIHTSGNPTPPPQSDPLGPAAQYPYLPESHSDGVYSCRLGGPRLYDLLNSMSLEPFGVLGWVILDREEEFFETDDVRDEDKVMQALWYRWIFLNRNKFVANFFNGTKSFIKDNWRMIHQAAGLGALRTWLLLLNIHNFLVTLEVVTLLRFYRGLTDMQHWYGDKDAGQNVVAPV
ncbi:hypothetical protein K503DRAFT_770448 [Rhizopogon vinicolor AM-OR11-026]|uniref:Uncharacterized protein n=1 Tax=Rhizopogon vinicolor AM-OR11-026 TaxID=1314800 RepID=A0A1B7N0V4_9AGAM|nr:hypothetical protein K503DRAFT_770448 [Rhizopogon vinicolor AM-OR11-026]